MNVHATARSILYCFYSVTGAETGVELADVLSNRLGVASNGEDLSVCRRNKYLMGEQAGLSTSAYYL